MSEVLITLVVIGIIAAITVPIMVTNYNEQTKRAKINKMYSTLSSLMTFAKAEGLDSTVFESDNYTSVQESTEWFNSYIKNRLSAVKICYDTQGCWSENTKRPNGQIVTTPAQSRPFIGLGSAVVSVILNDGTLLSFNIWQKGDIKKYLYINSNSGIVATFDINGVKGPGTFGKDVFSLVYTSDYGVVPPYLHATSQQKEKDCSSQGIGYSCILKYLN